MGDLVKNGRRFSLEFKKLNYCSINDRDKVCVKEMGDIIEISYVQHRNIKPSICKVDNDNYIVLSSGELKQCSHISSRADNKAQVSQSLKRLRDYINTNVTDVDKCKWITLTYKENMTDTKKLYIDFKNFIKRFKYKYGSIEYIVACEPQSRGAWHLHCIIIFSAVAPFIPNSVVEELWQHGFTKTTKLDNVDNVGAYLTAYLGDMELDDFLSSGVSFNNIVVKEIDKIEDIKLDKPKKFVKGGRLFMYPPKFNLYRISRGIKKPIKQYMSYALAKKKVGSLKPTFSSTISLSDYDNNYFNVISYECYNKKRNF